MYIYTYICLRKLLCVGLEMLEEALVSIHCCMAYSKTRGHLVAVNVLSYTPRVHSPVGPMNIHWFIFDIDFNEQIYQANKILICHMLFIYFCLSPSKDRSTTTSLTFECLGRLYAKWCRVGTISGHRIIIVHIVLQQRLDVPKSRAYPVEKKHRRITLRETMHVRHALA